MRRHVVYLVASIPLAILVMSTFLSKSSSQDSEARAGWFVIGVVDGDTIRVRPHPGSGGTVTVRIIGVDTPETVDPRKPIECYGPEAKSLTSQLEGEVVLLEFDERHFDDFGRLLAYVKRRDGVNWSVVLAASGAARPLDIPPNSRYSSEISAASSRAERLRLGLWGRC